MSAMHTLTIGLAASQADARPALTKGIIPQTINGLRVHIVNYKGSIGRTKIYFLKGCCCSDASLQVFPR
ncbi:MAG: hypothetical protein OXU44_01745, partial [Gammaproteobacteria bacterium]|nr:hypothetical protein [Gammaproteobacteria bacterium]